MKRAQWRGKRHAHLKFQRKAGLRTTKRYLSSSYVTRGKHRGLAADPSSVRSFECSGTQLFEEVDCTVRIKKIGHLNEKGSVPW